MRYSSYYLDYGIKGPVTQYHRVVVRIIKSLDKELGRLKRKYPYLSNSEAEKILKDAVMEYFR
jgi:hypothetical protein